MSPPAPAASEDRSSTRAWTSPTCWTTSPRSAARRCERAHDILGRSPGLAGLRRLRLARGRTQAAVARRLLRAGPRSRRPSPRWSRCPAFKTHVMNSSDERRGYPRPTTSSATRSRSPLEATAEAERYPELREPWQVLELCSRRSFNRPRMQAIDDAMIAHGLESPSEQRLKESTRSPSGTPASPPGCPARTTRRADQALLAHATQVDPDGSGRHPARAAGKPGPPRTTSW